MNLSRNNQVFINLTGITNAQTIQVTLFAVNDGTATADVSIPMSTLVGDTTGNGAVNSSDIAQTQSQSGQPVSESNFREDVTVKWSDQQRGYFPRSIEIRNSLAVRILRVDGSKDFSDRLELDVAGL